MRNVLDCTIFIDKDDACRATILSYCINKRCDSNMKRKGVTQTTKGEYNFVLGGHSHVKDVYTINDKSTYINNGYAIKSKTFLYINDHEISFPPLT